jgi:sRNA-binding protein
MTEAVRSKRDRIQGDLILLARWFPRVFREPDSDRGRLPLKIGIRGDILDDHVVDGDGIELSRRRIDQALRVYTSHPLYHSAMTKMSKRFDLQGQVAGEIDEPSRKRALITLSVRKRRAANKGRIRPSRNHPIPTGTPGPTGAFQSCS